MEEITQESLEAESNKIDFPCYNCGKDTGAKWKTLCIDCFKKSTRKDQKGQDIKQDDQIVQIHGKDFIRFEALLDMAHKEGKLQRITVQKLEVDHERKSAYCVMSVETGSTKYPTTVEAVGSANPDNLKEVMKGYYVEMAQTRALSRCFRYMLNVDKVAVEELKSDAPTEEEII